MIIVDTSVWVDFFYGKDSPEVHTLEQILAAGEDICVCGVILTEVLQGIRKDGDYRETLSRFESFLFLPMNQRTFVKAAELYRILRHKGITIRNTVDCIWLIHWLLQVLGNLSHSVVSSPRQPTPYPSPGGDFRLFPIFGSPPWRGQGWVLHCAITSYPSQ